MIRNFFSIDTRSLALFRIGLGCILLLDLWFRSSELIAHYTDLGVYPREAFPHTSMWVSPHFLGGSLLFQSVMFIISALIAVSLLVGYQTQLATFLSWILLISLHDRNPMILNGGDIVLRMILFWGMFLPLGASWSWDSRAPPKQVCTAASAALLLQVCLIYWTSILYKWNDHWLSGNAVGYALHIDQFTTRFGIWLRSSPALYPFLTYLTLAIEIFGPLLAWIPWRRQLLRTYAVFLFIGLHVAFSLALELGIFPAICCIAWLPFLPSSFWEDLGYVSPDEKPLTGSTGFNLVIASLLIYVTTINLVNGYGKPSWWRRSYFTPAKFLHIQQRWNMFSRPLRDNGWFLVIGKTSDGTWLNLVTDEPATWKKPPVVSKTFPNARWRKYLMNLWWVKNEKHRPYYVNYIVRRWEERHPGKKVELAQFIFLNHKNLDNFTQKEKEKVTLWSNGY